MIPAETARMVDALHVAVAMRIWDLRALDLDTRTEVRMRWAREAADAVAYQGDALQFGGKRGEAAGVFNRLAKGLAAAAFNPGGITAFGQHWCADHDECRRADEQAAASPLDWRTDGEPEPERDPYITIEIPGVSR